MIAKYSGAGNSFLFFELSEKLELSKIREQKDFSIPKLCIDLQADGVIFLEPSKQADCCMRIFNADGSEAEMCGNGLRCSIVFLRDLGKQRRVYTIETRAGIKRGWIEGEQVVTEMGVPHSFRPSLSIEIEDEVHIGHFLNTGVPHFVMFSSNDLDLVQVEKIGRTLRFHPFFGSEGTNVSFATFPNHSSFSIRTYERGVERETPACGTAGVAAALIASKLFDIDSPIELIPRSGERLKIRFNTNWSEVIMQGPVKKII